MPEEIMKRLDRFLEEDIQKLSEEVKKTSLKTEFREMRGEEIVKESLKSWPIPENEPAPKREILPSYLQSADPKTRLAVENLIDIAIHRGIGKALKDARKNPFILDAFRDALVTKIYPELKKRGVVK